MVHIFKAHGVTYAVDSNSGSIFQLDEAAHSVIAARLENKTPPANSDEAQKEINALIDEGVLFRADPKDSELDGFIIPRTKTNVKALCLNIAHDCNLRCKYCFAGEGDYNGAKSLMSLDVAKRAVDLLIKESGNRKNLEIDFFGGEPLLNLSVVKGTIKYARERAREFGKKFRFTITTNCLALNKQTAHYLNEVMDNVVLSIDGRPEVHNRVRKAVNGKDVFEQIIQNALYFASIRGEKDYFVRGTYTNQNLDFVSDIKYLLDRGFKKLSLEPVVLPPTHELAIREEHLERIYKEYDNLSELYIKEHKAGRGFVFFHYMLSFNNSPCLRKVVTACGAGCEYLAINPNGDCYPCHQFVGKEEWKIGSLGEKPAQRISEMISERIDYLFGGMVDVAFGDAVGNLVGDLIDDTIGKQELNRDLMAQLRDNTVFSKPECGKCFAKYFCSGGCLANNYSLCGSLNTPHDISCKIIRKRIESAISVQYQLLN